MLKNVLIITPPENYGYMEELVKKSWNHFFGLICDSATTAISWLKKSNSCDYDLIIAAVSDDQIEKFGKRAFIIKFLADVMGIEVVQLNKNNVEQDEIKKIILEKLQS